ncbi:acetolactate decarboxylase [Commensalibacter papalotli (ex Servin-Garciduenas et al. 2014)]|uniref:Alpha-acetolactate decarboxylase n=1 Tax=Commensalibacter papalotli (ex Servin-Garciduenas et al. 2014) TaxID=1208583 RepID=W7DWA0_9PROT|nr:acetolactate decarboxylase [Commensalibacter papalotli (ex Servin-Garciduenas et al. 2014)]EUK19355.1 Alpha-acetolactate decarboxylase [Commensalibacter papalotli (ex Servin-Garciduenas et al. 2014)]
MSKIVQFSTIGALMAGHIQGEQAFARLRCGCNFGLGCSADLNGELTIFDGTAYEGTAGKTLKTLDFEARVPFIQLTDFKPEQEYLIEHVHHKNIYENLKRFTQPDNIFLAVSLEGVFEQVTFRRPYPSAEGHVRDVKEVAASQKIDTHQYIAGRLIGFWTPEIFGRIAVPGFHFHFLDESNQISGHVLEFYMNQAQLAFEEKQTIEVTNPSSKSYKDLKIDVSLLDDMIQKIEK